MRIQIIEEDFYKSIQPIEENYLEFLDMSDSFLGWLLTLNKEEFNEVYLRLIFPPGHIVDGITIKSLALPFVEMVHKGIWETTDDEASKRQVELRAYVRVIYLIKAGLLQYEPGDTDSMWKVEVTQKGTRLADALNVVQNLLFNKEKLKSNERKGQSDTADGSGLTIVD